MPIIGRCDESSERYQLLAGDEYADASRPDATRHEEGQLDGIPGAQRDGELGGAGHPPLPPRKENSWYPRRHGSYLPGESPLCGWPGWSKAYGAKWYTGRAVRVVRWLLPVRERAASFWEPVAWWHAVQHAEGKVKPYGMRQARTQRVRTEFPALPGKPVWGWRARVVACYTRRRWRERILMARIPYWLGVNLGRIERGELGWSVATQRAVERCRKRGEVEQQARRELAETRRLRREGKVRGPALRITVSSRGPILSLRTR